MRKPDGRECDGLRGDSAVKQQGSAVAEQRDKITHRSFPNWIHDDLQWSLAGGLPVRPDIAAEELLGAIASLCMHAFTQGPKHARRMVLC